MGISYIKYDVMSEITDLMCERLGQVAIWTIMDRWSVELGVKIHLVQGVRKSYFRFERMVKAQ